ncbi:cupin [Veronia nyctiphanis]|uniref:Cupin n=1 Tax=Veronia nyctiphanis TaxID=1278244 RepID=A0A4Q0YUW6_9GAMM|nr:cupin domain-containing protein [Veronia nyctiphanis]RXJ74625.1 cupin [Veronia nyctiphanis]
MHNMLFEQRVVIKTESLPWQADSLSGVYYKPLAYEKNTRGHDTRFVRVAPGTEIDCVGSAGEEILVVNGECRFLVDDKTLNARQGCYLRVPHGKSFKLMTHSGCLFLEKRNQFCATDSKTVFTDMALSTWTEAQGNLRMLTLHEFNGEQVALIQWPAGQHFFSISHFCGEEVFVLSGEYRDEFGRYPAGTWMRNPHMFEYNPFCQEDTLLWIKVGHLPYPG